MGWDSCRLFELEYRQTVLPSQIHEKSRKQHTTPNANLLSSSQINERASVIPPTIVSIR